MYRNRYTIQEIDEKVNWIEEVEEPTIEYDEGIESPSDIQDALKALEDGCWDNEDWRDTEVILYPADSSTDYRTGEVTRTTVIIKGRERGIHWLCQLYEGRESAKKSSHTSSE